MSSTRRHFLKVGAVSGLAAATPKLSANDQIQIATSGIGGMGNGDTRSALAAPGVKLVGACDVYEGRLTRVKEVYGKEIFTTRDYREILARKDIDAVIVATPDHWHQRISIEAMEAGKDVYCEKPMVQHIDEGPALIEAEKKAKRILQVGSQRVSNIVYAKTRELIKSGAIGELNMIDVTYDRNSAIGAWQYSIPPDASPKNIDWDTFIGHAKKRPFEPIRLFRWRNYQDYGTGVGGDLFVHLFSGVHVVMDSIGPNRVYATGGLRYWDDGRDVPDVLFALCDYPKTTTHPAFNVQLRVNFADGSGGSHRFRFTGSEGTITLYTDRAILANKPRPKAPGYTISTFAKTTQEEFLKKYHEKYPVEEPSADGMEPATEEIFEAPRGYSDGRHHHRNFYESVRSRKPVVEDATFGFRAAGPALLGNISYFERRICNWDPEAMKLSS